MTDQEKNEIQAYEWNNESLSVTVNKEPHCVVKFDIKVKPEATKAAYKKAIKEVTKEVSIPGFRKGKAPVDWILTNCKNEIQNSFNHLVMETAFKEALEGTDLFPLSNKTVRRPVLHLCKVDEGAHFEIEFECRPEIPSVDLNNIVLRKVEVKEVSEEDYEEALENIRVRMGTFDPVQRSVQENDYIDAEITLSKGKEKRSTEKKRVEVSGKSIPKGLFEKVIGAKVGDIINGEMDQGGSENDEPIHCTLHIIEVLEPKLPLVDEEFAKSVGSETVEELKEKIYTSLRDQAEAAAEEEQMRALEGFLVENYPIAFPNSMLKNYVQDLYQALLEENSSRNEQDLTEDFKHKVFQNALYRAVTNLTLYHLFHKIASDHQLALENEDLYDELTYQLNQAARGIQTPYLSGSEQERADFLHRQALERKVKNFLLEQASFAT